MREIDEVIGLLIDEGDDEGAELVRGLAAEVERLRAALERIAALEHDFQQRRTVTLMDITGWAFAALSGAPKSN